MSKPLATVRGTMLTPGVSRNGRLYTQELIAKAVSRMRERLADPNGLPIVMRTHHEAGDNSALIVGRVTQVDLDERGNANYRASLYNTGPAKDIAGLVVGDQPALKSVSIHGYWLSKPRQVSYEGQRVTTADDLEIDAVDFTASPGVAGAVVTQASYYSDDATTESSNGRFVLTESMQAELTAVDEATDEVGAWIGEKYNTAQRKAMASKGQAMKDGSYPVSNKADLRKAVRAVGRGNSGHDAIRKHIIDRAKALGLTDMIPDDWTSNGSMKEQDPVDDGDESVTPTVAVTEGHVVVCVSDDLGNEIVKVCAANVDRKTLKSAGKKALQLAARIVDKADDDAIDFDGDDDEDQAQADAGVPDDDSAVKSTNPQFVVKPGSDPQAPQPSYETVNVTVHLGGKQIHEAILNLIANKTSGASPSETKTSTMDIERQESVVSDETKTEAVAQAAPTPGITEADMTKIGSLIGESIKQAMLAMAEQQAAAKAAKQAARESKNDAETKATETAEQTKAAVVEVKEPGFSAAELKETLAKELKAELRESILKESGLPSRRGFRHVSESDTDVTPTGDDLWDRRGEIWSQIMPWGKNTVVPVPVATDSAES